MRIDPRALLKLPLPTLAFGALNIALLAGVLVVAFNGTRASELLATPAKVPAPLSIDIANAPPTPDLAAIQSQPLMHSSRTFYTAPPENAPVTPPLPEYRLAGSFIAPDKPSVALLANPQGGTTRRVRAGEELDGWRVQTIEAKRVVLKWQEQTREITAATPQLSAGLKRVPMKRQRIAGTAGTVVPLGSTGSNTSLGGAQSSAGGVSDTPRFYRPPPN